MTVGCTRYAPSTTGYAHPGTMLSALLTWLDARSRGDRVVLRLENLDRDRCKPIYADAMRDDLAWLGLDWDATRAQDTLAAQHQAALDRLAADGRLYPCDCSRSRRRAHGKPAPDGGWAYDNHCRSRPLPASGWRDAGVAIRLRLPDRAVELVGEDGGDLSQHPARDMGDPIVVRRDGACAYHLVVVVDDAAEGVTRVIRGRDLAPSAATQVLVHELLELPLPVYRHHFLLLEPRAGKLAKLHGSVSARELRPGRSGAAMCGWLAHAAGLRDRAEPCTPAELAVDFDWANVRRDDLEVTWDPARQLLATRDPTPRI